MGINSLGFREIMRRAEGFRTVLSSSKSIQDFTTGLLEADNSLREDSLAPVVGTICDQQVNAEDAWAFPYWLSEQITTRKLSAKAVCALGKEQLRNHLISFFNNKWPTGMSESNRNKYLTYVTRYLNQTCNIVEKQYKSNPDNLFKDGTFTVAEIYFILRSLPGIGPKKASMIARDFVKAEGLWYEGLRERLGKQKVEFIITGKHLSEIPVDVHVVKVFGRVMGEFIRVPQREKFVDYWQDIQNFAKVTCPEFHGRLGEILWHVGRKYCHTNQPNCIACPLQDIPCAYAQ